MAADRRSRWDGSSTQEIRIAIRNKTRGEGTSGKNGQPDERRNGGDRRGWHSMPTVPFVDSRGVVVSGDRRKCPDRRVNSIDVEWVDEKKRDR